MLKFHDPRGEVAIEEEIYDLTFDLQPDTQATVGLLANGFPDSENFLSAIGDALRKRYPNLTVKCWNKGNASIPAPADMLDEIRSSCDFAIAAYGH